ncbi:MAG: transcription termination factor NusA, partial [Dehalococcoidales bacterium]
EYAGKEGDIISAVVERVEPKQVLVSLGRGEAIMPLPEQMPTERYRNGQRIKVFLVEVARTAKGPLLVVSRSHPNLVRRLFELEVPEVFNGVVEIKSVAREAGFRSKVAVATTQTGIDPVGCCVGLRGIRIQNIVTELSGEKIDVVSWNEDPAIFIASALSPATVVRVELDEAEKSVRAIIPDRQLSLAIGKMGQNVRLAVKLTGWRIDIKSATEADAEAALAGETVEGAAEAPEPVLPGEEPIPVAVEKEAAKDDEGEALPLTTFETPAAPEAAVASKPAIRFAEDLRPVAPPKPEVKTRKKKKKKANLGKDSVKDGIKLKKKKRGAAAEIEDEEEYI